MAYRALQARYAGHCSVCRVAIPAGTQVWWESSSRTLRCETCGDPAGDNVPVEVTADNAPGASAQREYERRKTRREDRIRAAHPRLGSLILAFSEEPQSTEAWARGAEGERRLGSRLDALAAGGAVVLHDRRIVGGRANIDHIVVASSGVWVIDAKRYTGTVTKQDRGGWRRRDDRLFVGRRDRSALLAGLARQAAAVTAVLADTPAGQHVHPVLCFVDADWRLFARPLRFGDVSVTWPNALIQQAGLPGPLNALDVHAAGQRLIRARPPA